MSVLPILQYDNKILRRYSDRIENITSEILTLIVDMADTMRANDGVGLAAPQIGRNIRLFIAIDKNGYAKPFINPEIIDSSGEMSFTQGCLSIKDEWISVPRKSNVTLTYTDRDGFSHTETISGMLAQIVQHEMDHLNGKLIVDYR